MAITMFQQNENIFKIKIDEFNDLCQQNALTQSKHLVFEKMKLVFLQAEQKFKFMKLNLDHLQIFIKKTLHKFRKKLRDLQSNLDKIPLSNISSNSKKQPPSQIKGIQIVRNSGFSVIRS
ncbi:unnamed protein product [Paramecium primaurelia]|uniref:Uncharacterized protein n=1 Tax=Paramecium primaurelia TaxID=5886 RepID=A0A8S1QFY1_PARPR|nr:unnamed protein product [Paramecium primaurelia]